ncbi:hypothetical protein BH20ACT5_BH20ACT5_20390 [soil metagenome]
MTSGYTLDAGALIAFERGDTRIRGLLREALRAGLGVRIPAGVLAQVWHDPARQVVLGRLTRGTEVQHVPLDSAAAKRAGLLCAISGTADVVDASVAACAREHGDVVVTSDAEDLVRLIPARRIVAL